MPTPRPIIVASVGEMVGTSTTCPSSPTMLRPAPRPRIAVRIGRPIATTVPNVSSRMITAAESPTASLLSVLGRDTFWPR